VIDMPDPKRLKKLGDLAMRLLAAAIDRDTDTTVGLLEEIGTEYGTHGMYGTCCALAETVRQFAFPKVKQGDGSLTGDLVFIQQTPGSKGDPYALWAARFVAAYINGDADTSTALFFGNVRDADAHTGGVVALVAMAADLAREKENGK
jgi:hypothetical protein